MQHKYLGQILLHKHVVTQVQLNQALEEQKTSGLRLGSILIQYKWATEEQICEALSAQFNIPFTNLSDKLIDKSIAEKIPAKFAYRHKIVPIQLKNNVLTLALSDPLNLQAIDQHGLESAEYSIFSITITTYAPSSYSNDSLMGNSAGQSESANY
ncbi:MAG: hypothetical protein WC955_03790, partial [Elusimicrobiota bacterium]